MHYPTAVSPVFLKSRTVRLTVSTLSPHSLPILPMMSVAPDFFFVQVNVNVWMLSVALHRDELSEHKKRI